MKLKNKKILICILCVVLVLLIFAVVLILLLAPNKKGITVLDAEGNVMAELHGLPLNVNDSSEEMYRQYMQLAVPEAVKKYAQQENCDEETATKKLLKQNAVIHTAFSSKAFETCKNGFQSPVAKEYAAVLTDGQGKILCLYSAPNDANFAYALMQTQPYSSLKPLSVYAQAIENGKANYTKAYLDDYVKTVVNEKGEKKLWPQNATHTYSKEPVLLCEGLKESLNTVAVRCLMEDVGAKNSLAFLKKNFNMSLEPEEQMLKTGGEAEILGNLALGYLQTGVSPLEMAGYYQIFINAGTYREPFSVEKITNQQGKEIYKHEEKVQKVISEDTAYIMNQLLQKTTEFGGTAEKAKVLGLKIGGKTGTGTEHIGNWFVGFTPEYICSVWHGKADRGTCTEVFANIIKNLPHDKQKEYPTCASVQTMPFCVESGMKMTIQCKKMDIGFYKESDTIETCTLHQAKN